VPRTPLTLIVLAIALGACASLHPSAAPTHSAPPAVGDGLHWFRDSAEQRAIYTQTFREAGNAARELSAGLAPRSWAVILDIDETILDNSEYEKRLVAAGQPFSASTWTAWVQERRATALPGAAQFLNTVLDELHGQVVLITNRNEAECPATEDNLHSVGLRYDRILCAATYESDKNPRFERIQGGEPGIPALNVLLWMGDNIRDFPSLSQKSPGDLTAFGVRFFALPNPMYGSWTENPYR
jgi:5'-nucleotidase (lipoprotein e(P4) family)